MEMAQMGVRTRAREALPMEAAAAATSPEPSPKRRKISNNNRASQDLKFSASSFVDQLKSIGQEGTVPPPPAEERCSSPPSDESPASCCSSNGSSGLDEERIKFLDLEVQSSQAETSACNCGDEIRREVSLSSELGTNSQEVESMEKKPITKPNSRCVLSTLMKMPTDLELEDFFAAAEKDIQKRFSDKYNYDIVKDVPLEGRYEWIKLNP